MGETLTIDACYCGPPESGNGGYVAGRVAALIGDAAEVTLRLPPPLAQPLRVERLPDKNVRILDGDSVVVEAKPAAPDLALPPAVDFDTAAGAVDHDAIVQRNTFAACFVCGPGRKGGDGLRIFPGKINDDGVLAAPWLPHANFADDDGRVLPEFIWSALDCPSGFAAAGAAVGPLVLGRIVGRVSGALRVGDKAVVMSWPRGHEGRKYYAGSALYTPAGECVGLAETIWLSPRTAF